MEITIKKSDLAAELGRVQSVVERKMTLPVLANVLMEAADGRVSLTASDLDVTMVTSAPADVQVPGSATIPARKLHEIVRALPDGCDVQIAMDGKDAARVHAFGFDAKMLTLPREDFPQIPALPLVAHVQLPAATIGQLLKRVAFAVTGEDTRYYLNGAMFELGPSGASMVSTDGHRMAKATWAGELPLKDQRQSIIPAKCLGELLRLLDDADADSVMTFERGENHLFFVRDGRMLATRMVDGKFPAYDKVIPRGNDKRARVVRLPLASALRRVAIMATSKGRSVRLTIGDGRIVIEATSAEAGNARETVAADTGSDKLTVTVNASYLIDFTDVVATEAIEMLLKDEMTQVLMRPADGGPIDYTYVVMPMRT